MESGAILIYLADKTGRLLPGSGEARYRVMEWLMWQMGGIGPFLGQAHHFLHFNRGKAPYAEERFRNEARRLYGVLDRRLEGRDFVADDYSIADIAIWPWISRFEWQEVDLGRFPEREALVSGDCRPAGRAEGLSRCRNSRRTFRCRERITGRFTTDEASAGAAEPVAATACASTRSATSTAASTC